MEDKAWIDVTIAISNDMVTWPGDQKVRISRSSSIGVNSVTDWRFKPFLDNYVYLSSDAARYLVDSGVSCIGVDYLSVAGKENGAEVHQLLLNSDVTIIEGLDLRTIDEGIYEMIALPMKIAGSDGAPARVLLRKTV